MAASWECPSLPMLSFPMKESGRASFLGIKPVRGGVGGVGGEGRGVHPFQIARQGESELTRLA